MLLCDKIHLKDLLWNDFHSVRDIHIDDRKARERIIRIAKDAELPESFISELESCHEIEMI